MGGLPKKNSNGCDSMNFRLVGKENSPPLITLSIAPLFVSLSTAYLYLYIVWLMCSGPGASEEM